MMLKMSHSVAISQVATKWSCRNASSDIREQDKTLNLTSALYK